jgi:hypothetical protein
MFQDYNLHTIHQCGDAMVFDVVIEGMQRSLNNSGIQVNGHPVLKGNKVNMRKNITIKRIKKRLTASLVERRDWKDLITSMSLREGPLASRAARRMSSA